jgi:hypothetical protein
VISAWKALSDGQKVALTNMAKGAGAFVVAWQAGLVQPLLAATAALVTRMAILLSPKIMLAGLAGIPYFIGSLGVGRAIEKAFDFSTVLLRFAAWGKSLAKSAAAIFATLISPFINFGQAIGAAMRGDTELARSFLSRAMEIESKGKLLTGAFAQIEKDYQAELADIASVALPTPAIGGKQFTLLALEEIGKAFEETGDMAEDKAKELADRLGKKFGITDAGDAIGQFIENYKNAKIKDGPIDQIGDEAEKAEEKVEALNLAVKKAKRGSGGGSVFRGGTIESFDIGAQFKKPAKRFGGPAGLLQEFRGGLQGGRPIDGALPEVGAAAGADRLAGDFGGERQGDLAAGVRNAHTIDRSGIAKPMIDFPKLDFSMIKPGIDPAVVKTALESLKTERESLAELKKLSSRECGGWY